MHTRGTSGEMSAWSIFLIFVGLGVLFVLFVPVIFPHYHGGEKSNCESNLKQIGGAIRLYGQDWHDTYPINGSCQSNGRFGHASCYVKLTPAGVIDPITNKQRVGQYGRSWVEVLYDYMEPPSQDSNGAWECKRASGDRYPQDSRTAYVTYAMNRDLVGRPEDCVRMADHLMLVREMDRHVNSELRPTNYSCGRPDVPPDSPFLNDSDSRLGKTEPQLHGMGSHMLFADCHVQLFPASAFPQQRDITAKNCWDAKDKQWYNCLTGPNAKKIAITP